MSVVPKTANVPIREQTLIAAWGAFLHATGKRRPTALRFVKWVVHNKPEILQLVTEAALVEFGKEKVRGERPVSRERSS